ncbi:hypothetical protein KJ636_02530 [Patescibacteria group bacterium]|nr:hypothetical protein [Patescibacteria group bacterium]
MVKIIEKNLIKLKEPAVIIPLKKWKEIEEILGDWEDMVRFNKAISDPENQQLISFEKVKKKLNLP